MGDRASRGWGQPKRGAGRRSAADLTDFTDGWTWSRVTPGGSTTLDLITTGSHNLEACMRVDRMLLVTDTNYIPSGLGPAESPFQTITQTIPDGLRAS